MPIEIKVLLLFGLCLLIHTTSEELKERETNENI